MTGTSGTILRIAGYRLVVYEAERFDRRRVSVHRIGTKRRQVGVGLRFGITSWLDIGVTLTRRTKTP